MKWLRSLFKKAELEEFNIKSSELYEWFIEKSDPMVESAKSDMDLKFKDINQKISLVKEKLVVLAEATLKNENIPERAKHIMQGNRETYIKLTQAFINAIKDEIPEDMNYNNVSDFISFFEEKLDSLNKSTAKSYYILQEFFANESSEVALLVKEIDAVVRNLNDNNLKKIIDIKKAITALESLLKSKKNLEENIVETKQAVNITKNLINDTANHVKRLKESKDYSKLGELLNEKTSIKAKLKNHELTLAGNFSPLARSMRKYARVVLDDHEILENYADDPLKSLIADKDFKIIDMLYKMKTAVSDDQIDVKDKEKERVIEKINEISKEHLKSMLSLYKDLKEQLHDVDKRIRLSNIMREIEEQEYKYSHLKDKLQKKIMEVEKLEKQKERDDISRVKEQLEEDVNSLIDDAHMNVILEENKVVENEEETA